MVGILGSILAGGVAGGAGAYNQLADERRKEAREKAKEEALFKRQESLMRMGQRYQDEVRDGEIARQTGKENIADADARMMALSLKGETGELGGDEYSVPMGQEDMKKSMSGKGLLALTTAEMAQEGKAAKTAYDQEQDAFKNKIEQDKLELLIAKSKEGKEVTLYKDGAEVTTKDAERVADLVSKGWTDVKKDKVTAAEIKRRQEESNGIIAGMVPGFDSETKTAMIEKKEAPNALDALRRNGYPNAKIVDEKEDKNMIMPDGPTMVTISSGRFDHTAIDSQEADGETGQSNKQVPEQLKTVLTALSAGDVSVLDSMDNATLGKTLDDLAAYLGKPKNQVIAEIKKMRDTADPPPEPDPPPGILAPPGYGDSRKGDPLAEKDKYSDGYLLPGIPRALKKAKDVLTDKSEYEKMTKFAPKPY